MGHSIAIDHHTHAARDLVRRHQLLAGTILGSLCGALIGALVFAIAQPALLEVVRDIVPAKTVPVEPAIEFPAREIPPEWQWQGKGLDVDYMYRQAPSQRLDWIQEGAEYR